ISVSSVVAGASTPGQVEGTRTGKASDSARIGKARERPWLIREKITAPFEGAGGSADDGEALRGPHARSDHRDEVHAGRNLAPAGIDAVPCERFKTSGRLP